jgi:hypothetical protein
MDVKRLELIAASAIVLYENHLSGQGKLKDDIRLARAMKLLRKEVTPEALEKCKEAQCQARAKAES